MFRVNSQGIEKRIRRSSDSPIDPDFQKRSQARAQAVLTPKPIVPLDGTPEVAQLRAHLNKGSIMEGTSFKGLGENGEEEEENYVEKEDSDDTEVIPSPLRASEGTGGLTLAQSNQNVSNNSDPFLLDIMQQMTQIMANLQEASSHESSRPPAFKTPSMKAIGFFYGTQPFKVISFIQSCQLTFHNYQENFSHNRKIFLYVTSSFCWKGFKMIDNYHSNPTNQDQKYLLNNWALFQSQLFTLFGDPNKVRKAEAELGASSMKEGGNVSL
ncbi:hypothetical protein O181_006064 [Austropuccinia psidii MF-1]|uniref:Uncharacterized protein n=1 Tax=Austropuccinia psidii MF-1 TaxID=1389203 RepID=A0A9Q3BIN3_9BASI|nr:hypothetical protein [Austropuccinia psidii MF-1]